MRAKKHEKQKREKKTNRHSDSIAINFDDVVLREEKRSGLRVESSDISHTSNKRKRNAGRTLRKERKKARKQESRK
jgi:hypothetical protein